jgi:general secretion pathway protein L
MTAAETITASFWRWLDQVAETLLAAIARLSASRTVRLVEADGGQFVLAGTQSITSAAEPAVFRFEDGKIVGAQVETALRRGRIELMMRPDRFIFKPLELPSRAAEFLDGVVRSQIDRLTPWSPDRAAFGCSRPADAGSGRIVVTVAATAKAVVAPYLQAFGGLDVRSISISTHAPDSSPEAPDIKVAEENLGGLLELAQARRILLAILLLAALVATGASIAAIIVGGNLQARQDELARGIAKSRAAAIAARNAPGDPATVAERALARRKNETPSAVIVLEVLSQILPDHTYVTEMRIEGDKLRVTGITRDAPMLIRLIERSRHFTGATFFAPTTRGSSDPGDRFHIEARMEPVFSP